MSGFEKMQAQWADQSRRQSEANEVNQRVIFDALAALGIERLEISFDGCGDSGQIEDITVIGGSGVLSGDLTIEFAPWDGANQSRKCPLAEAVEDLCYGLLKREHEGWEINDGAFGSFAFDVAKREIELEFNGRYTDYETSTHTFTEA